jgi:hypothetical protein
VLQWARANGCPWDESTCANAAERGHLEERLSLSHRPQLIAKAMSTSSYLGGDMMEGNECMFVPMQAGDMRACVQVDLSALIR